ncbi:MAG TPA: ABC-2 family transporter protein, partial [Chloroflexota bacterium]|nr:ABC-2 family transporter protein [Chloroflexota bacterium]
RVGAMNELQYRANFFVQLLQSFVALGTGLASLWLIYSHTSTLDGWTSDELLALMGIHILMGGVIGTVIQPNMERLMADVQQGTLDFALIKPEDAQLLVSVREIRFWQVVDILTGLGVLLVAAFRLQARIGIWQTLAFLLVLLLGMLLIYCFWLILTTAAFWVVRMDEIVNLFQGVYAAGRYPVTIYPGWLRAGLTFLVPVAFAVTVPAEAITGRLTAQTVVGALALTALALALARLVWRLGLRRYSGASS